MKKLSVFFMLAILFLCPLVTFACSHTCEFGEWQLIKEATCTEDGIERRYCIHNNTHFEERPIDAIGHEFGEWITITTPTCGNTGLKKRYCSHDNSHFEQEVIDTLPHDFGSWSTFKDPTCTEQGIERRYCSHNNTHFEERSTNALGHEFGEWVVTKNPTCIEEGVETKVCSRDSKHIETRPVSKIAHSLGEWVTTTDPTYQSDGLKTKRCKTDGCSYFETEAIPKLEYLCFLTTVVESTETSIGIEQSGEYSLADPQCPILGYTFAGWVDEDGNAFASSGTISESITVRSTWKIAETTTFAQLKERIEGGVGEINIAGDFELEDTIFVTDNTVIYSSKNSTLTRASDFLGDLFVLGEDKDGNDVILQNKTIALNLQTKNGSTLTFDGNKSNMTGTVCGTAFYISNSSTLNMYENVTIQNFEKLANDRVNKDFSYLSSINNAGGSAIMAMYGTFNMYGGTLANNYASLKDSKLYPDEADDYYKSSAGGAIYNRANVNIFDGTIENCQSARGSAIYNYKVVNIYKANIQNNYASVYGGAIYSAGTQYGVLYIGQSSNENLVTFKNNTAQYSGGAIFSQEVNGFVIYGATTFEDNKSEKANGGAINTSGAILATDVIFKNNIAASKGGAIYAYYGNNEYMIRISDIKDSIFEENKASKGGAISFSATSESLTYGARGYFNNCEFKNNIAFLTSLESPEEIEYNKDMSEVSETFNGNGGAVHLSRKARLHFTYTKFTGCDAQNYGGAIYATVDAYLNINTCSFDTNTATGNGGAIYNSNDTEIEILNSTFANNVANSSSYGGGALYFTGSTGKISNSTFTSNSAKKNGGAIAVYSASTLTAENITMTSNTANSGGAIYLSKSETTIKGLTAQQNEVSKTGGAITAYSGSIVTIENIVANNNSSSENGGAIYNSGSTIVVKKSNETASTISNNTSGACGGAIAIHSEGTIKLYGITLENNTATDDGGALYVKGGTAVLGDSENTAEVLFNANKANYGGAIYVQTSTTVDSQLDAYNLKLTNNIGTKNAGGMYISSDGTDGRIVNANIENLVATGNSTTNNGGVLYAYTSSTINIKTVNANSNTAENFGGFAYISGPAQVLIEEANGTLNSALQGGYIYLTKTGSTLSILSGNATGNTATDTESAGGATIWSNTTKATIYLVGGKDTTTFVYDKGGIAGKLTIQEYVAEEATEE